MPAVSWETNINNMDIFSRGVFMLSVELGWRPIAMASSEEA